MSLYFNCIFSFDLQPNILKGVLSKNSQIHFWSLVWSYRRDSLILLKSFPSMKFWKIKLAFWFQKWFIVDLKQHS
jgi:hypothetical protein